MEFHGVIPILEDAIAVGVGTSVQFPVAGKTFQAMGVVDSGTGSATIEVQGSLDNVNFDTPGTISITFDTAGNTSVDNSFVSIDHYNYYRGEVTAISGTGATVKLLMGY